MALIIGFILIIIFGILITFSLGLKINPLERIGLAYLLGFGIFTLLLFFSYLLGFKFSLLNSIIILTSVSLILFGFYRKHFKEFFREVKNQFLKMDFSISEITMMLIIFSLFFYNLIMALYWPLVDWDAMALYDFRAKVFVATGSMDEGIRRGYFFGYPLLSSLANAWVYFLGGDNPKFLYALYYLGLILIFYSRLRQHGGRKLALFGTLSIATTPMLFEQAAVAYTNLPYITYLVSGILYLSAALSEKKYNFVILGVLLTGLSTWVRSTEPFWIISIAFIFLYCLFTRKFRILFFSLVLFFLIQQPWKIYEARHAGQLYSTTGLISNSATILITNINSQRLAQVLRFLYNSVLNAWQPLLSLFLVFFILQIKNSFKQKNLVILFFIMSNFIILLVGAYIFSFQYSVWEAIPGSAERMSLFFLPLFVYYIFSSDLIKQLFNKNE